MSSLEQCPPGTVARLKAPRSNRSNQKFSRTLMPFCRKCSPGEYQSQYDQVTCDQCPPNTISPRGSTSPDNCHPKQYQPCSQINVCGSHGTCKQEVSNPFLYSCSCEDGFVGSHCEHQVNQTMNISTLISVSFTPHNSSVGRMPVGTMSQWRYVL